jgi:hypothetical protein
MKTIERILREHSSDYGNPEISSGNKRIRTDRSGSLRYVGVPNHISDYMSQNNSKVVDLDPDVITATNSNWERHRALRKRKRDEFVSTAAVERPAKKDVIDQT